MRRLLQFVAMLALILVGASCIERASATPRDTTILLSTLESPGELVDLRVGAVCNGPATMSACLVTLVDSTANNAILATNVAVAKGDTLWRTRTCTVNEEVVIGGTFIGTAPNKTNSAPVGARGAGPCTATAGSPVVTIVVQPSSP